MWLLQFPPVRYQKAYEALSLDTSPYPSTQTRALCIFISVGMREDTAGSQESAIYSLNPLVLSRWPCISYLACVFFCFLLLKNRKQAPPSKVVRNKWDNSWSKVSKTYNTYWPYLTLNLCSLQVNVGVSCSIRDANPGFHANHPLCSLFPHLPWRIREIMHVCDSLESALESTEHYKM